MTTPRHSPLPWTRGTDGVIYDAEHEYVTDTCGTSLPQGVENQVLIVNAVNNHPQLLELLRALAAVCEAACGLACAAIANATN